MTLTVAAFDFDKTITHSDTLLPFLYYVNTGLKKYYTALSLLPVFMQYKLGFLTNHDAKEELLTGFLKNKNLATITQQGKLFAKENLAKFIKPEALMRLQWHRVRGHVCIVISAGLEVYLKPWGDLIGLHVMATRLETNNNTITGKLSGENCFGAEKVNRLLQHFGPKEKYILYAYGDSRGDRELLALADYAYYKTMPVCD